MIIINYNKVLKSFDDVIVSYAKRINYEDYDDYAQEIRIYIFKNLYRFDPEKSALFYYLKLLVVTAYRKIVFDKKKQEVFEDSFSHMSGDYWPDVCREFDLYSELLSDIVIKLPDDMGIVVFYAILYNKGELSYSEIAKKLNLNYSTFFSYVKQVRATITGMLKER